MASEQKAQLRTTPTGAVRDVANGKGRFDLLPARALLEVAVRFQDGAARYGCRNWEKGMPLSWFVDSGLRHSFAVLEGKTDENHAAAAAWNWLAYLETKARIAAGLLPPELDDLPK